MTDMLENKVSTYNWSQLSDSARMKPNKNHYLERQICISDVGLTSNLCFLASLRNSRCSLSWLHKNVRMYLHEYEIKQCNKL